MNYKVKPITVAVGAVMTACLTGAVFADTEEDPFALEAAGEGYNLLAGDHEGEGECGEGKCGDEGGDGDDGDGDDGDDGGDDGDGGDDDGGEEEEEAAVEEPAAEE
jgi:uncharacterized low-complexity protein